MRSPVTASDLAARSRTDEPARRPEARARRFHQARWDEPIIFELTHARRTRRAGPAPRARRAGGGGRRRRRAARRAPARARAPALPEIGQMRVLKHYLRLSQENLGADFNVDIGQGTCTMKYSPKINDQLAAPRSSPRCTRIRTRQTRRACSRSSGSSSGCSPRSPAWTGLAAHAGRIGRDLGEHRDDPRLSTRPAGRVRSATRSSRRSSATPRTRLPRRPPATRSSRLPGRRRLPRRSRR